jgi:murein DD-endopeptidase MepM/ murein hydrolase activator NlpD
MSDPQRKKRFLSIMLVPEDGREARTFRLSYRLLRTLTGLGAVVALGLTLIAGSWWYLAARASRVTELQRQVQALQAEGARIQELSRQLASMEKEYDRLRGLFGATTSELPSDVWLPPTDGAGRPHPADTRNIAKRSIPSSWPLTERGFVTQGLETGEKGDHPGLDIAVPTDSYVRAAGAGTVVDVGEDPVYGRFVIIDHGDGYTSLYGHASLTLVTPGEQVRQDEVIALSGSTGRSTAPHLHFEILKDGKPVDPLTLVHQP